MSPTRRFRWIVATLAIVGGACAPAGSDSSGSGGGQGTGGQTNTGGATATGGSSSSTGGASQASGGSGQPGTGGNATNTGGSSNPGSGGRASGGSGPGSGGAAAGSGGRAGGATGQAGSGSAGRSGASGGSTGAGGAAGAVGSTGCGKMRTLQNGTLNITFGGASRKYILKVPDNYDINHPYRVVFAYAESGASAMSVATRNYFTMAALDTGKTTIFVAPDAANGTGSWSKSDVELTDAILAQLQGDLCIDKTRLFATGFSFGGGMAIALGCTRADVFRGIAFFSGADLTGSCPATLTKPIAFYASQASGDSSGTPMPSSGKVKQAQFAAVNGCMPEPNALNFPAAGQPHTCTIYKGCSPGYPTVYCVFEGAHGWEPRDPGQSMSWNAPEAWKFITQF